MMGGGVRPGGRPLTPDSARVTLREIATFRIPNRPNRQEPRVVRRRAKPHKLMTEPREALKNRLKPGTIPSEAPS
jgi:hypothetical protein